MGLDGKDALQRYHVKDGATAAAACCNEEQSQRNDKSGEPSWDCRVPIPQHCVLDDFTQLSSSSRLNTKDDSTSAF